MRTITFFNNNGGVGKTTTVYHVAWMLSELGIKTLAIDLDPQPNLTSMFLTEERLWEVYENNSSITVLDAITPIVGGDPATPVHIEQITDDLGLILGDPVLFTFEDTLSVAWFNCLNSKPDSFRVTSIFKTIIDEAAHRFGAEIILIDVGSNVGAINRSVTISSDYIIMPVASDLFSLQGIKNLGTTLHLWKKQWSQRKDLKPQNLLGGIPPVHIPENNTTPAGYIVMQYSAKESRSVGGIPLKSYLKWANRIPKVFKEYVLRIPDDHMLTVDNDTHCIALLKHFRSLAPMSMEAHKPIFLLKPGDGAIGAHVYAVQKSYEEFETLTRKILDKCP